MARKKPHAITDDELRRLYVDERLTMKAIGQRVGLSAPSVLLRLRNADIPTRTRITPCAPDVLRPLAEAGLTRPQIARELGVSAARVGQALRQHGIDVRDGRAHPKPWRRKPRVRFSGYWMLYRPDHPYADKRGRVMEHRLVMEEQIGRYLRPEEVVHHMNHVRDDNRPENLMLLPDNAAHTRLHSEARRKK